MTRGVGLTAYVPIARPGRDGGACAAIAPGAPEQRPSAQNKVGIRGRTPDRYGSCLQPAARNTVMVPSANGPATFNAHSPNGMGSGLVQDVFCLPARIQQRSPAEMSVRRAAKQKTLYLMEFSFAIELVSMLVPPMRKIIQSHRLNA